MRVGTSKTAQVGAFAFADARDEERHARLLRLRRRDQAKATCNSSSNNERNLDPHGNPPHYEPGGYHIGTPDGIASPPDPERRADCDVQPK
jgi:hypothetical protein